MRQHTITDENNTQISLAKQMSVQQAMKVKPLSITSLALNIGAPYGSVTNNIFDLRNNPEMRAKIAGFQDLPAQQIFAGATPASREAGEGLQAQHA